MPTPRLSRRDLVRLMALGGAGFLSSPLTAAMFEDLGLASEARRAGIGQDDPAARPGEASKGTLATWGRLRFRCQGGDDDDWNAHPHGDLNLIGQINASTSANIEPRWNVADLAALDEMTRFPLLFMHAEVAAEVQPAERDHLLEYLARGGFLYAEDCVAGKYHHGDTSGSSDRFFRSMQRELTDLATRLPGATFARLPDEHPVFHSFFDLPGQPIMQGQPHGGWGLSQRGRLLAYLSANDCHCGWTNPGWFGDKGPSAAMMGTNVYVYAMTH